MYKFLPQSNDTLRSPAYVPGSIPVLLKGHVNPEEPFVTLESVRVTGPDGFVTVIPENFTYDMASVPRFFWRILSKTNPHILRGATLHDWLYDQRIGTREEADKHFYNVIRQDGLDATRAWGAYQAVRKFGGRAWRT